MDQRPTQEERVRASTEALLDAALELVAERGYAGASPALIAARAGYDRKMVHHRFGSKVGLFRALLERSFQRPLLAPTTNPELTGLERATSAMSALVKLYKDDPRFLRAVFTIAFQVAGAHSELGAIYHSWLLDARDAVTLALQQGQNDGSVKRSLDAHHAAQAAVDATTGLVFRWCLSPNEVDLEAELRTWTETARKLLGS
ncbi:TetR/AcrR family transcriptional regulator [Mycolicibacterium vaccae]|uniref:TetR/AcrR family transcriptional regulator n=1 Tax=Mycolicibacterium vaccae TaxID=1810 RepID=UPI003D06BCB2